MLSLVQEVNPYAWAVSRSVVVAPTPITSGSSAGEMKVLSKPSSPDEATTVTPAATAASSAVASAAPPPPYDLGDHVMRRFVIAFVCRRSPMTPTG